MGHRCPVWSSGHHGSREEFLSVLQVPTGALQNRAVAQRSVASCVSLAPHHQAQGAHGNRKNPLGSSMSNIDFFHDHETFTSLWRRACECAKIVAVTPASDLLHFDSANIATQVFLHLIRDITGFKGTGKFAVIVLNPDPFSYFHFHFGKYPAFIVDARHSDDDLFDILMKDPGDSPADAIGFYSEQYVVLPISGEWFMYADRAWDGGTGVLTGPSDVMTFARGAVWGGAWSTHIADEGQAKVEVRQER